MKRLQDIFRLLELYGAEDHITFDLSMSGNYGYYTGVIFRAYTYGTGDAIVRGGRYDHLLEKFGKKHAFHRFCHYRGRTDERPFQAEDPDRHRTPQPDRIHRSSGRRAITLAGFPRQRTQYVELMKNVPGNSWDETMHAGAYGQAFFCLFLNDDMKIEMINLETGEEKRSTEKKSFRIKGA